MCKATTNDVVHRIVSFATAQGWSKSRLAANAGLRDTTLRNFGSESWNPTLKILRRIEAVIPPEFGCNGNGEEAA